MHIRDIATSDFEAVHRFLSTNGWAHRIGDLQQCRRLIEASQRAVVAVEFGKVLGASSSAMERCRA
ncbi:MAG: hypothetical protein JSS14_11240 [Proteobacteria bacterium]|nr:hypothetical protein [Pseudomonadota bacterium]